MPPQSTDPPGSMRSLEGKPMVAGRAPAPQGSGLTPAPPRRIHSLGPASARCFGQTLGPSRRAPPQLPRQQQQEQQRPALGHGTWQEGSIHSPRGRADLTYQVAQPRD